MRIEHLLIERKKKAKKIEVTDRVPSFKLDQDMHSVISSLVYEMKEDNNKLAAKYDLPWTQAKYCNVQFEGDQIIMKVEERKGGFRIRGENGKVLNSQLADVIKLGEKFEKAIKKEFKERTGKALTIKGKSTKSDFEMVAYNGLYRFFTITTGKVSSKVEGQSFQD